MGVSLDALAADITWDGSEGSSWSNGDNWVGGTKPGTADKAIFNGAESSVSCTINESINVRGIEIQADYQGTVSQGSGITIQVRDYHFKQYGGTFTGSNATVSINNHIYLYGGIFNSTSGNLNIIGDFEITSGTFNHGSGTVAFQGANEHIKDNGTTTFNNLIFKSNIHTNRYVYDPIIILGTLTFDNGYVGLQGDGLLKPQGDVVINAAFQSNNVHIEFSGDAATQTVTGETNKLNQVSTKIAKSSGAVSMAGRLYLNEGNQYLYVNSGTLDMNDQDLEVGHTIEDNGGVITDIGKVTVNYKLRVMNGTFDCEDRAVVVRQLQIDQGATFIASSATTKVWGDLDSNGTFTHNSGTFVFEGSSEHIKSSGTLTFQDLTFKANLHQTRYVFDTIIILGTLTLDNGYVGHSENGELRPNGDVVIGTNFQSNNVHIKFVADTALQTITGDTDKLNNLNTTIDKTSGVVSLAGNLKLNANSYLYLNDGTLDMNDNELEVANQLKINGGVLTDIGKVTVNNKLWIASGQFDSENREVNINNLQVDQGTTFIASSVTTKVWGDLDANGTFTHNGGLFVFEGNSENIKSSGTLTFQDITFKANNNQHRYVYDPIIILGTLTLDNGYVSHSDVGELRPNGNVVIGTNFQSNNVPIKFVTDTALQTITGETDKLNNLNTIIDKTSGVVSLAGNLKLNANSYLYLNDGTLDMNDNELEVANQLKINGGVLTDIGKVTVNNKLWIASGQFDSENREVNINNLQVDQGTTFIASSVTTKVWGDLDANGTFTHNGGLFVFEGNSENIKSSGTLTFQDLTFKANLHQNRAVYDPIIVLGTLTFEGGYANISEQGALTVNSDVVVEAGFQSSNLPITFSGNAATQTLNLTGGADKLNGNITISKSSGVVNVTGGKLDLDQGGQDLTLTGGTLNVGSNGFEVNDIFKLDGGVFAHDGNVPMKVNNRLWVVNGHFDCKTSSPSIKNLWIENSGEFTAGVTTTIIDDFLNTGSGTFNHNSGKMLFTGAGKKIDVNSSETFHKIDFQPVLHNSRNVASNDVIIVNDELRFKRGVVNRIDSAIIHAKGDVYVEAESQDSGSMNIIFNGTSGAQTFTYVGGSGNFAANVTINNDVNLGSSMLLNNGAQDLTLNDKLNIGSYDVTVGDWTTINNGGELINAGSNTLSMTRLKVNSGGKFDGKDSVVTHSDNLEIAAGGTYIATSDITSITNYFKVYGDFQHSQGHVKLYGGNQLFDVDTELEVWDLTLDPNNYNSRNIGANDIIKVKNDLFINDGVIAPATATLEVDGNVEIHSDFNGGGNSVKLVFKGDQETTFNLNNAYALFDGLITIDKTGNGAVKLLSQLTLNANNQHFYVDGGTLDLNGFNLTTGGGGSRKFVIKTGAKLKTKGDETISANAGYPQLDSASTFIYYGPNSYNIKDYAYQNLEFDGPGTYTLTGAEDIGGDLNIKQGLFFLDGNDLTVTGTVNNEATLRLKGDETVSFTNDTNSGTIEYVGTSSYNKLAGGYNYFNLEFDGVDGSWQQAANLDVNGDLTITNGTLNSNSKNINLAGNWANAGTYTSGTNTVTLDGGNQSISGTTTFSGLTKSAKTNATLSFDDSTTYTFTGLFMAYGTSASSKLTIASLSPGNAFTLDPQSGRALQYVNMSDTIVSGTEMNCTLGCTDNNGNTNVKFTLNLPSKATTTTWEFNDANPANVFTFDNGFITVNETDVSENRAQLVDLDPGAGVLYQTNGDAAYGNWTRVKTVNISNSGTTLTDYQVPITVTYDSDMKSDFSDLRFVDSDKTALNYYVVSKTDADTASIIVKMPSLPNGTRAIKMYYGNSGASSLSNAANTYFFYKDMQTDPGGTLQQNASYVSGQYIQLTQNSNGQWGHWYYSLNPGDSFIAEFEFWTGGGNGADAVWFYAYATSRQAGEDQANGGYNFVFDEYNDQIQLKWNGGSISTLGQSGIDNAQWRQVKVVHSGTNSKMYLDNVLKIDHTDSSRTKTGPYLGFGARTGGLNHYHRVRNVKISKYRAVQPSVNFLSEQTNADESKISIAPSAGGTKPTYTQAYFFESVPTSNSAGEVMFQVSADGGSTYKWLNPANLTWETITANQRQYTPAPLVNAYLSSLGTGDFSYRAILVSDSTQAVELDKVKFVSVNNTPPVASTGDAVTVNEATFNFPATASCTDADVDDDLTGTWTLVNGTGNGSFNGTPDTGKTPLGVAASYVNPSVDANTVLTFRLTCDDGMATDTDDVLITVNAAANVDAGPDRAIDEETGSVTLTGASGSDPNTEPVTFLWIEDADLSNACTIVSPTVQKPTINVLNKKEAYVCDLTMRVSDGKQFSTDSMRISVSANNDPPDVEAGVQTANLTEGVSKTTSAFAPTPASAFDPEQGVMTYLWEFTSNPGNKCTLTNPTLLNATVSTTKESLSNFACTLKLTATDDGSSTANDTITLNYTAVDDKPDANDQSVRTKRNTEKEITLTGLEHEGQEMTFALVSDPTHGALSGFDAATGAVVYTPTTGYVGEDTFTFKTNDGSNDSETNGTVTVTVTGTVLVETDNTTVVAEIGGIDTFTVKLVSQPTDNAIVNVLPDAECLTDKSSLTFLTSDWNTPQTVTVTAVDDDDEEGAHTCAISFTTTSDDLMYNAVSLDDLSVNIVDSAGVIVTASNNTTSVTEAGNTDNYTVVLANEPTHHVKVEITTAEDCTVSPATVTFAVAEWDTPVTATVTAVDDLVAEGSETCRITHTVKSADNLYDGISVAFIDSTVVDDDAAGVDFNLTTSNVVTTSGVTNTASLVLTSKPTADVLVAFTSGEGLVANPASITISPSTWNVTQYITLSLGVDAVVTGNSAGVHATATSTDANYKGISISSLNMSILDDSEVEIDEELVANAGSDHGVKELKTAHLRGRANISGVTCSWLEVDGTETVSIENASSCHASFTAPEVLDKILTLTFELTVSYGTQTASDTVNIFVRPAVLTDENTHSVKGSGTVKGNTKTGDSIIEEVVTVGSETKTRLILGNNNMIFVSEGEDVHLLRIGSWTLVGYPAFRGDYGLLYALKTGEVTNRRVDLDNDSLGNGIDSFVHYGAVADGYFGSRLIGGDFNGDGEYEILAPNLANYGSVYVLTYPDLEINNLIIGKAGSKISNNLICSRYLGKDSHDIIIGLLPTNVDLDSISFLDYSFAETVAQSASYNLITWDDDVPDTMNVETDAELYLASELNGNLMATGDLVNSDAHDDLVVAELNGSTIDLYEGVSEYVLQEVIEASDSITFDDCPIRALVAGDANGDGTADLLVGCPSAAGGKGRIYIVFGMDETNMIEIVGNEGEGIGDYIYVSGGSGSDIAIITNSGDDDNNTYFINQEASDETTITGSGLGPGGTSCSLQKTKINHKSFNLFFNLIFGLMSVLAMVAMLRRLRGRE